MSVINSHSLNIPAKMKSFLNRFNQEGNSELSQSHNFTPRIEITDKKKSYVICAEVPGMDEKDIKIYFRDKSLILEGEKKVEHNKEEDGVVTSELSYGSFYRSIPLKKPVNTESIKAVFKNGRLRMEIEKTQSKRKNVAMSTKHS